MSFHRTSIRLHPDTRYIYHNYPYNIKYIAKLPQSNKKTTQTNHHTNVFAKTTIILSYLSVYYYKLICYTMIVIILNYHSSITTIMVKNDNVLCINYTIKTGTVRKQVRNMLKRLLFSSRQAFLLSKTAFKAA